MLDVITSDIIDTDSQPYFQFTVKSVSLSNPIQHYVPILINSWTYFYISYHLGLQKLSIMVQNHDNYFKQIFSNVVQNQMQEYSLHMNNNSKNKKKQFKGLIKYITMQTGENSYKETSFYGEQSRIDRIDLSCPVTFNKPGYTGDLTYYCSGLLHVTDPRELEFYVKSVKLNKSDKSDKLLVCLYINNIVYSQTITQSIFEVKLPFSINLGIIQNDPQAIKLCTENQ